MSWEERNIIYENELRNLRFWLSEDVNLKRNKFLLKPCYEYTLHSSSVLIIFREHFTPESARDRTPYREFLFVLEARHIAAGSGHSLLRDSCWNRPCNSGGFRPAVWPAIVAAVVQWQAAYETAAEACWLEISNINTCGKYDYEHYPVVVIERIVFTYLYMKLKWQLSAIWCEPVASKVAAAEAAGFGARSRLTRSSCFICLSFSRCSRISSCRFLISSSAERLSADEGGRLSKKLRILIYSTVQ